MKNAWKGQLASGLAVFAIAGIASMAAFAKGPNSPEGAGDLNGTWTAGDPDGIQNVPWKKRQAAKRLWKIPTGRAARQLGEKRLLWRNGSKARGQRSRKPAAKG